MHVIYIGLESYNSRYTFQLTEWNREHFQKLGVAFDPITSEHYDSGDEDIKTGQVLDAHRRGYHALSQVQQLLLRHQAGHMGPDTVIFFEDMYHPGIDALFYALQQAHPDKKDRPKIVVRCLAQSIDPDDFVNLRKPGLYKWMRHYEKMVAAAVDGVLVASEEMLPNMFIAGFENVPIAVTGLPFGKREVQSRCPKPPEFFDRPMRVSFASRWDAEKQPEFYLKVAKAFRAEFPGTDVEFCILSGKPLTSNHEAFMSAGSTSGIVIYENLPKNDYYRLLSESRVLFNCALQDWVSNTVSEADALGCNLVFPAYRSFPEVFKDAAPEEKLYIPWSVDDAVAKLHQALHTPQSAQGVVSDYQDRSIGRSIAAMAAVVQGSLLPLSQYDYRLKMKHRI